MNAFASFFYVRRDLPFRKMRLHGYIALLATGFFAASAWAAKHGPYDIRELYFVEYLDRKTFLTVLAVTVACLWTYAFLRNSTRPVYRVLLVTATFYGLRLLARVGNDVYLCLSVAVLLVILSCYLRRGDKLGLADFPMPEPVALLLLFGCMAGFALVVGRASVYKYDAFGTATFDFGIFAQAFEQLRLTGVPMTTVEREGALSHFAVHYSPIFYLIEPLYALAPNPATLLWIQAGAVALGALPVYLICRRLRMEPLSALLGGVLYLLLPTMASGTLYDFHENKLLAAPLLFFVYLVLCERPLLALPFAALTLGVKEDAFIYVLAVGLYMLFGRGEKRPLRQKLFGALYVAGSFVYFFAALSVIRQNGGEPMVSRFADYTTNPNGGFKEMIETVFYDLGFLLKRMLTATYPGANPADKVAFLLWVFVPMLALPFRNRIPSAYFLLVPMLVINLMQSWPYQYHIGFQYTFGSVPLALVMMLLVLGDMDEERRRGLLVTSLAVATVFVTSASFSTLRFSYTYYTARADDYTAAAALLEDYRDELTDAKVICGGYVMPQLYYVTDLDECPRMGSAAALVATKEADYFVLDTRATDECARARVLMAGDFRLVAEAGIVQIYRRIGPDHAQ